MNIYDQTRKLAGAWYPQVRENTGTDRLEYERMLKYFTNILPQPTPTVIKTKTLDDFSETELIMELIGRGYAVSKLPVDEHVEATKA